MVGLFSFHLVNEFKCSILPTLNISRNVIIDGKEYLCVLKSSSIFAKSSAMLFTAASLTISAEKGTSLPVVSSLSNILEFSPLAKITVFVSFGKSFNSAADSKTLKALLFLYFNNCCIDSHFSLSILLVEITT